ncbi:Swi5-domain-containing protein [Pleomassaria siparia CBS 279.74]|uniref:Swi5-domain-containing protein n=1 Tax=Pleomassaria siparia CBS 279.74 TaxID=1314801 RepID=A0A6G1KQW8_9PLEO|nr:Swi5-domain-containing protein [Pleomassaria siparia CBS 279.74]
MPTSDIDATHDSTSEIAATSNGTKEVDQHGNRGPHSTIEHTTLPETSNQGASIHDTEITMHAALVKESGELSMQTDYPNSETTPQPQLPASSPSKILLSPKKPSLSKTTQEATVAELRAHRAALITSLAATSKFQELIADDGEEAEDDLNTSPRDPNAEPTDAKIMKVANKIVKTHIKLLHEYNEMKDVGQGLMGLIADSRGVRVVEVQDEFGIEAKD